MIRSPATLRAPILPVSRYSTMSGAISVESMRTRTGASVSLRIWCAPSLPRGNAYQRTAFKGDDEGVFCHARRGTSYSSEIWAPHLNAALKAAGVKGRVRPFHDLRHSAITLDAASGASEIAVMTKAGHSSFATTRTYLHLAGTVFRDEAERMERMALGRSTELSTDLSEPHRTSGDATPAEQAEGTPA